MTTLQAATILIIEDDDALRQTLAEMIMLNGFQVLVASDGPAGLALAQSAQPAIIITDLNLPGMTGFELLETFRGDEALRAIPVIVISAKVDRAAMRRGMELGATDFITKPFTEAEVMHSIAARLEKKELLDELDAFAHTVAHDLKSPLCTLNGRIELAAMMLGTADEATLRHHLHEAVHSARRLNDIIEELLILSGVRRQAVVSQPLDTTVIVTEALNRLEHLLQAHGAKVRLPAVWPEAFGYAPWVIEVWANFISNAAKYGGAQPVITVGGEAGADGRSARFWVQDAGLGLDADAQAMMFVPFTRISSVRVQGHGLGLSIVRRIVEKLHGKVGVQSESGHGARFWFELPTHGPAPTKIQPAGPPDLFLP